MISAVKEFVYNHRKKICVGIFLGGAVAGSKYVQHRFVEWQEKESKDFVERTKKQQYFDRSEKTCNQTILSLSSTLKDNVLKLVDCENIINKLRTNSSNKVELWQELKILVFTKVSMLIYSGSLLVVALRIKLNIIGGYIYCKAMSPESFSAVSEEMQENYLSKCNYFLNEGIRELCPLVQEKVQLALEDVTLDKNLSLQKLENIFWAIQSSINSDVRSPLKSMVKLLYGNNISDKNMFIKNMMSDTVDLLQRREITDLASSCINRGFSNLTDKISGFFLSAYLNPGTNEHSKTVDSARFVNPNSVSKPLAKLIPIINGFGNPGTFDSSESWVSPFIVMEDLKILGANIYESYSSSL